MNVPYEQQTLCTANPAPIHIICAADAMYGPYAGIMLCSILRTNPDELFHFHVLSDGIRQRDVRRIAALVEGGPSKVFVYDLKTKLEQHPYVLKISHHLTRATYARFFFDSLLPTNVQHAIYVDCDVVCLAPIRELWAFGKSVPLLAATPDQGESTSLKETLGIPSHGNYYNCGVLLLNMERWRRSNVGARLLEFIANNSDKIYWLDQDTINGVLWSDIVELPRRWNVMLASMPRNRAKEDIEDAVIIHFNGGFKPWHYRYEGPYKREFYHAKKASPWKWQMPIFPLVTRILSVIENPDRLKKAIARRVCILARKVRGNLL
jgi:lipopolysaccharide biosynthesis glycosyltransferase